VSINQAPGLTTADATASSRPNAVLQADGKIVVDGYAWNSPASAFYSLLIRCNADDSVDTTRLYQR
jgi:hypothetical protein